MLGTLSASFYDRITLEMERSTARLSKSTAKLSRTWRFGAICRCPGALPFLRDRRYSQSVALPATMRRHHTTRRRCLRSNGRILALASLPSEAYPPYLILVQHHCMFTLATVPFPVVPSCDMTLRPSEEHLISSHCRVGFGGEQESEMFCH